jgi:2-polyprenyl-6-hydroxyphenyl methylase/3-demethylubiquinone-9 3-methyltransferase
MNSIKNHYDARYRGINKDSLEPEQQDTFAQRVETAMKLLPSHKCRILDYGCGRGGAARRFCDAGHDVDAIDISSEVVKLAMKYEPRAKYHVIESEQALPFKGESFDACFSSEVIEHVFDIRAYLSEIRRVLKPNGQLMLTTPYHGAAKNLILAVRGFERHFDPYHGHIRFFTRASLTRCLVDSNFAVQTYRGVGRFWPFHKTMFVSARRIEVCDSHSPK